MRLPLILIFLCAATVTRAQTPSPSPAPTDLTTLSKKTYHHARVFRVEPDGITYMYDGGMSKIDFADLPESIRKQYGYDPAKAAAFAAADENAQDATRAANAKDAAQAARQTLATNEAAARDIDAAAKAKRAPAQAGGSSLDRPATSVNYGTEQISGRTGPAESYTGDLSAAGGKVHLEGKVTQIVDEGIIIMLGTGRTVLLTDYAKQGLVIEDAICDVRGSKDGVFEYVSVLGAKSRIGKYKFASGNIKNPRR